MKCQCKTLFQHTMPPSPLSPRFHHPWSWIRKPFLHRHNLSHTKKKLLTMITDVINYVSSKDVWFISRFTSIKSLMSKQSTNKCHYVLPSRFGLECFIPNLTEQILLITFFFCKRFSKIFCSLRSIKIIGFFHCFYTFKQLLLQCRWI